MYLLACNTQIPETDPRRFACVDDLPFDKDKRPCPQSHWCPGEACTPRLNCSVLAVDGSESTGCTERLQRCELVFNQDNAAVRCEPGVHTSTSTHPPDTECTCPDGTHCVAFARGLDARTYPLFAIPNGTRFPPNVPGVLGEVPEWRMCVRVCSGELDCPTAHTCKATAVLAPQLLADPSISRYTVGTCYPDRLVSTSTVNALAQPDPTICLHAGECPESEVCKYSVVKVEDHPVFKAQEAWTERFALQGRCAPAQGTPDGNGCTVGEGGACQSGLCDRQCKTPCDPRRVNACGNRPCIARSISRRVQEGVNVTDLVFYCQ